jgi:hypothetical protein
VAAARDVLAALSAPTAIVAAAIAFGYAGTLLAPHFVGAALLLMASFAIQSFAAALVGRVLYGRGVCATLEPFALTLAAQELLFVGVTATSLLLPWRAGIAVGIAFAAACLGWTVYLTYAMYRAFGERLRRRRLRALGAVALQFATIAVLVCLYAHAQDLLPYPPGRP